MNEAVLDPTPYIATSHNSTEKHLVNAELYHCFNKYTAVTTRMATLTLSTLGYKPFYQKRVGIYGELFELPKLQTMPSTDMPHTPDNKDGLHPVAQFVRRFGLDEFIQTLLVSPNPLEPGPMSAVSHRPQTLEELDQMEHVMSKAGESRRFNDWFENIYCSKRPGVISPESFLDNFHEPASYEYYSERIKLGEWYHEHGSPLVDHSIIFRATAFGAIGVQSYLSEKAYLNK